MNYFEKCKIRIENAKFIEVVFGYLVKKCIIDEELVLIKFTYLDSKNYYTINFKEVGVPISENEIRHLYELSEKKLAELDNVRNEEILRDL